MGNAPMMCLVEYRGFDLLGRHPLAPFVGEGRICKLGSDPSSHVMVDARGVAPVHAVVECGRNGDAVLVDLGADLGTRLNGQPVHRARLAIGDRIEMGSALLVVERSTVVDAAVPHDEVWAQDVKDDAAPGADAVDVRILWGTNVLHFVELAPPRAYVLGSATSDFTLPDGSPVELVAMRAGEPRVIVPKGPGVYVRHRNGTTLTIAECVAKGLAEPGASGFELRLPHGATVTMQIASLTVEVSRAGAGEQPIAGLLQGADLAAHAYTGMSALVHATLIGALAFFLPSMRADDAEAVDRNSVAAMMPYLDAIAERETKPIEEVTEKSDGPSGGGQGAAARGPSGSIGTSMPRTASAGRWAIRGDAQDTKLAHDRAIQEAIDFGMVGMLNSMTGVANAPVAPWADVAAGHDPNSALGKMWAANIDDAFGFGLGPMGTGEMGGGLSQGIGIDGIGSTVGHGVGDLGGDGPGHGPGSQYGRLGIGHGPGTGGHVAKALSMRPEPITQLDGTLPGEVIQRVVRQNFGRFRLCYEAGLRSNPGLGGRVSVAFVIDRTGGVSLAAASSGTDMPDAQVVSCVVRGFQNLSFPAPSAGTVRVVYPLMLTPGE